MEIQVTIGGPLADAINNLAAAVQAGGLIDRVSAPKKAKVKPESATPEPNAVAPSAEATASAVPAPVVTREAAQTLAALKAKKAGASVVKGVIADTGYSQIADIPEGAVLASLIANLGAL